MVMTSKEFLALVAPGAVAEKRPVKVTVHPRVRDDPEGKPAEFTFYVIGQDGNKIQLSRYPDVNYGPWMPTESVRHFVNDLACEADLPLSGHPLVDAVITGRAKCLGKGDDGVVFQVGRYVVKMSTTVPFQPENPGHRSPQEAVEMLRRQVELGNRLADMGAPGVQRSEFILHGDKGFQVKPWVRIPEKFTLAQLDEVQDMVLAWHKLGYVFHDEVQVGVERDGRLVFFDIGKAGPVGTGYWSKDDTRADLSSVARLYERSGEVFVSRDADAATQEWQRVEGRVLGLSKKEPISAKAAAFLEHMVWEAAKKRQDTARSLFHDDELGLDIELDVINGDVRDALARIERARSR